MLRCRASFPSCMSSAGSQPSNCRHWVKPLRTSAWATSLNAGSGTQVSSAAMSHASNSSTDSR
eukprot:3327558-Heterocapsa_arctica.AAC.1